MFLCLSVDNCSGINGEWVIIFFCYISFDKELASKLAQGLQSSKVNNIQKGLKETS